jgi:hypothetical protein
MCASTDSAGVVAVQVDPGRARSESGARQGPALGFVEGMRKDPVASVTEHGKA